ncbi:hypothetical protein D8674_022325 [Pyrus ussuriensis x Pyrus communis]|uniref:Uncharacterized protein n=1 Tax=Pyrus ussuriensis x Pyrus communis TaxID=2448454 RepID=A0A5N5GKT6_9ROSA|nr:hypothetical protein D8674_022325 [Pyrus ussuriensis x Pyrus communis]
MEEMSECSTGLEGQAPKVFNAASAKAAFDHAIKTLTLEDIRFMGRDSGQSSARGISSRNRGERQVLAFFMAASLEVGGVGEEDKEEQSADRVVILGFGGGLKGWRCECFGGVWEMGIGGWVVGGVWSFDGFCVDFERVGSHLSVLTE